MDVTSQVKFLESAGDCLPITQCVCGATFPAGSQTQTVSIYPDWPWECPKCGAKLVFTKVVRVFKVGPPP